MTLKQGQHRKYNPYVFTELGVAMLSSVLRSEKAIHVNIAIMRAFVRMRSILAAHKQLARQLENHDKEITAIWKVIKKLMSEPIKTMSEIGFRDRSKDREY